MKFDWKCIALGIVIGVYVVPKLPVKLPGA